jgi:hypothetical protein
MKALKRVGMAHCSPKISHLFFAQSTLGKIEMEQIRVPFDKSADIFDGN